MRNKASNSAKDLKAKNKGNWVRIPVFVGQGRRSTDRKLKMLHFFAHRALTGMKKIGWKTSWCRLLLEVIEFNFPKIRDSQRISITGLILGPDEHTAIGSATDA